MRLFLDICQGLGLGAAVGVRPFLPALLTGALATGDLGVDFEHTSYRFLESPVWLLALAVLLVGGFLLRARLETPTGVAALGGISIGLGALLFAGTLADHGYASWPGLVGGAAAAAVGQAASSDLLARTAKRLDAAARAALPMYFETVGLVVAGLSVLAPPVGVVALAALAWLRVGGARRSGRKFAGLRILR
ncbi:MAG TPA: DUF4126 family protein [Solirubrobacteraceae bacterium]|nr:DUF4126 family protein [Solirubrobacteraceae bacterium]